jgi:hypothetical protein
MHSNPILGTILRNSLTAFAVDRATDGKFEPWHFRPTNEVYKEEVRTFQPRSKMLTLSDLIRAFDVFQDPEAANPNKLYTVCLLLSVQLE